MAALRLFTVFRPVAGVMDFEPTARLRAPDLADATAQAARITRVPIVCHAYVGGREPVDFSLVPPPRRRSRRHVQ